MKRNPVPLPSSRPDPRILATLALLQAFCVAFLILVAGTTLLAWIIPPLGRALPHVFLLMRANTSFLITLSAISISLSLTKRSRLSVVAARLLGGFIAVFSSLILLKDIGIISLRIETVLAPDAASIYPGKVSPEAAVCFIVIGIVLLDLRARKRLLARFMDIITLILSVAMLNFSARYLFGLSHLFILYQNNPFSVQTFVSLLLLTFLIGSRRAEYGVFSIILDSGTGGNAARLAAPFAILLPFLIAVPKALLVRYHPYLESNATAAATSIFSAVAFCLVLVLARRTEQFEATVRELSLRDELTGLYNRRGFYILAEQSLRLARRAGESSFVLFIDVDELKKTNDTLGHEEGSALLRAVATLIKQTFRETDAIARLGGDEFVVAGRAGAVNVERLVQYLEAAAAHLNTTAAFPFKVSFSLGYVLSESSGSQTLEQLLEAADHIMYEAKRIKKCLRPESLPHNPLTGPEPRNDSGYSIPSAPPALATPARS
jgi:diguanylate cyclase (GGDEF)-like protein